MRGEKKFVHFDDDLRQPCMEGWQRIDFGEREREARRGEERQREKRDICSFTTPVQKLP